MSETDKENKKEVQESLFDDLEVKEVRQLEEGKYTGEIVSIDRYTEKYDYTRYKIAVVDQDLTLQVGYPTDINMTNEGVPSTQHAKFLVKMGIDLSKGEKVGEKIKGLIGKKVSFFVEQEENKNGTFSVIVKSTIKPL